MGGGLLAVAFDGAVAELVAPVAAVVVADAAADASFVATDVAASPVLPSFGSSAPEPVVGCADGTSRTGTCGG